MKQLRFGAIFCLLFFIGAASVSAADFTIRPFFIDLSGEARDYLEEEVVLTNTGDVRLNVYAAVNEITVDTEGEIKEFISPIMSDRTNTVTSWVEITRARIQLDPGESESVPLAFRIHHNPEPGEYHVLISFGTGSNQPQVLAAAKRGELDGIIVKLTIEDQREEFLRVSGFLVDRFIALDNNKTIEIELENLGDIDAKPQGEIVFFNSLGEEVEAIPVNTDEITIPAGETRSILAAIPLGNELGRFKANLALQYGETQTASLYDTAQFFMVPIHIMILLFALALFTGVAIFILLYRAIHNDEEEDIDIPLYVRDGHEPNPLDHDIDLSNKN